MEFLEIFEYLASTISSTKLIIEKNILIQHIKDIKGTKKTKYEFSSFKIREKNINEKKNNFYKFALTPRKMRKNM